jgi:hypothetical protein
MSTTTQSNTQVTVPTVPFVSTAIPSLEGFSLTAETLAFLVSFLTVKGQFFSIVWRRPMKTRKGTTSLIEKMVSGVFRAGIDYDNKQSVQDKRESGELPAVNQGLPWGQWLVFPHIISHKGNLYLRIYPANANQVRAEYFLNGESARREEIEPLCLASEFAERGEVECMTVTLSHVKTAKPI